MQSMIASAEDILLSKLEWAAISESERQIRDALRIAEIQSTLNLVYLRRWADELGVSQRLEEVLTAAGH
ncbi:hypothetical protein M4951_00385 [Blastopirellula sp. J2-11]|uniref:hypothetical protein n=1 Tax=Blastopirellula sp. J2-11 TaxID=2943192 RepID=UPI0021C77D63|nr:hypothetical protein [Blastopirellula sp. J2-11]UUO06784.1 hypothetical protein M4951_00385 [Blastopirellula sp. J2-11]